MKPKIFADRIFYYECVLNNPEQIIKTLEDTDSILTERDAITKWQLWTASDDTSFVFGYQKHTDSRKLATTNPDVAFVYNILQKLLVSIGAHYTNTLSLEQVPPSPLSISKYIAGASMGAHVDDYKQPGVTPIMSGVVYLNDNLEGGELFFPQQNIKIKPKAGSVIVFPSVEPFYHESLPVTKGEKYMSPVFWVRLDSMKREE